MNRIVFWSMFVCNDTVVLLMCVCVFFLGIIVYNSVCELPCVSSINLEADIMELLPKTKKFELIEDSIDS